jgi:hypothetical protein
MPAKPPESTPDRIRSEPPRNSFSPRPTFSRPARRSQYRAVTASGGRARKGPLHGTQRSLHLGGCVRAGATLRGRAPLTPAPTSSRPPRAALRKNPHPVVRRARKRSARALEAPPRHGLAGGIVAVPPRRHQAPPSRSAAGGTATRLRVKIAVPAVIGAALVSLEGLPCGLVATASCAKRRACPVHCAPSSCSWPSGRPRARRRPKAFGVGAAAAPGHGTPGAAAQTRTICVNYAPGPVRRRISLARRAGRVYREPTARMLSLRAHLPPTPEPLGSSAVPLGRGLTRFLGVCENPHDFPSCMPTAEILTPWQLT